MGARAPGAIVQRARSAGSTALLRQAKIEQLRAGLRQHDVARLQISVDDSLSMRLVQGRGDFDGNS